MLLCQVAKESKQDHGKPVAAFLSRGQTSRRIPLAEARWVPSARSQQKRTPPKPKANRFFWRQEGLLGEGSAVLARSAAESQEAQSVAEPPVWHAFQFLLRIPNLGINCQKEGVPLLDYLKCLTLCRGDWGSGEGFAGIGLRLGVWGLGGLLL